MRNRKVILAIMAGAVLALTACGGSTSTQTSEKEAEAIVEETAETPEAAETVETAGAADATDSSESGEAYIVESFEESESGGPVGMPNPWTDTKNLEEAEKATGIDFEPPVEGALPQEYTLDTYRYTDDLLEAVYTNGDDQIIIRVSKSLNGDMLSGDYNTYSKEWEENYKGLVVKCKGDGTRINCATADVEDMHFAVLINPGEEGKGMTADELKSLYMGMQAVPAQD